jgi:hypothetical protein
MASYNQFHKMRRSMKTQMDFKEMCRKELENVYHTKAMYLPNPHFDNYDLHPHSFLKEIYS